MPKTDKAADKAEEKVTEATDKASEEKKFPYNVLKNQTVMLFGVTTSTFVGATHGMENGEYSISAMKSIIDKWLNKPIKKEEK